MNEATYQLKRQEELQRLESETLQSIDYWKKQLDDFHNDKDKWELGSRYGEVCMEAIKNRELYLEKVRQSLSGVPATYLAMREPYKHFSKAISQLKESDEINPRTS